MLAFVAILIRKKGREKDIGRTSVAILFRKEEIEHVTYIILLQNSHPIIRELLNRMQTQM